MTMTLVETIEVGSGGAASITFSGIPSDADDLLILFSARSTSTTQALYMGINNEAVDVTGRRLTGTGSGVSSATTGSGFFGYPSLSTDTSNTFGNLSIYIPNYTSAANKSISVDTVSENNATAANQGIFALTWASTDAITQIRLLTAGNLAQYSTASLYKITKA